MLVVEEVLVALGLEVLIVVAKLVGVVMFLVVVVVVAQTAPAFGVLTSC